MTRKRLSNVTLVWAAVYFTVPGSALAAMQTVIATETKWPDKNHKHVERITIDGSRARIDVLEKDGRRQPGLPYLITSDSGKSWLVADSKKTVCANWSTERFFQKAGFLLNKYSRIVNAKVISSGVKLLEQSEGPTILGHKTRYVKIDSHAEMKAAFLMFSFRYRLNIIDEVWFATQLKFDPIEQEWIRASSHTGYQTIDNVMQSWDRYIDGQILKQNSVTKVTDLKKNKVTTDKIKSVSVVSIRHIGSSELPADLFVKPECSAVSETDLAEEVKDMLRKVVQ